ncbi:Flp pilus assembly protein TadG [Caulobacter ginsengisoli]|uniref:Flp pilus assembly protein TadG n=1 Tax=Caulobacter ginsengisoli TaxID=400775 RepID=A0ABU0IWU5_9CAUL|nr:pilus assembly protein TadG-related protein [Caulobacter ginsengisoli]MDQ0466491.1 Flp pilus assembly protein TadG [Caulobacter ginsengisoli]
MCGAVKFLKSWLGDRRGNVAVIAALSMPLVAGGAAFGVESSYWYYDQLRIQQAADAAAYAAALENRAGSSTASMTAAALAAATANGFNAATDTLIVNTPPTSGPNQNANSVEVKLARAETRYFSQIFISTPAIVRGRAVATYQTAANACILALDKGASRAIEFTGSSTVSLNGCNVMANSIADEAVYSQGATTVSVPCLMSAGGASINAEVTLTACAAPITQMAPVKDPFKDLAEPALTGQCRNSNGATLQPGRYCNGLNLQGSKNLNPGTYIIDGGTLRTNGSSVISGSGVTFYLTNGADVSFNGNASLTLSAPTTGDLTGILFFGGRSNTGSVTLNGTAGSNLTGALYFPNQSVSYLGDMQGSNGCTQVVARTVSWSGNANLAVDCTAYGMSALPVGGAVKLME